MLTISTVTVDTTEVVLRITLTILNKDCDNFLEEDFRKEVWNIISCHSSIV